MRVLKAGKSRYYGAALRYFEHAKRCYQQASQPAQWQQVVDEVYARHGRKTSLLPGFDEVVTGIDPAPQSSFLDRAKTRWQQHVVDRQASHSMIALPTR